MRILTRNYDMVNSGKSYFKMNHILKLKEAD